MCKNEVKKLQFFWTFFWAILLGNMATYVISSMKGNEFDLMQGSAAGIFLAIAVIAINSILPSTKENH